MNALSQEARALIDSTATLDGPSQADKARVRARLAAELGAAAFATLALSSASAGALVKASAESTLSQKTGASLFSKLALSGAAAATLVAGALWLSGGSEADVKPRPAARLEAKPPAPVLPTPEAAPSVASEPALVAPEVVQPEPARSADSGDRRSARTRAELPRAPAPAAEPAPVASTLRDELKLLSEAQAALRNGAPERALSLTAQHRASFAEGVLKEERQGIEVLANCALGRDYRVQAKAFLDSAQSSPLRTRVQKACGLLP